MRKIQLRCRSVVVSFNFVIMKGKLPIIIFAKKRKFCRKCLRNRQPPCDFASQNWWVFAFLFYPFLLSCVCAVCTVNLSVIVVCCWWLGVGCRVLTVDFRILLSVVVVGSWSWGPGFWVLVVDGWYVVVAHLFHWQCPALKRDDVTAGL